MTPRERIVTSARSWVGTPFHHQASVKAVGCDCLGLLRGIWRELYQREPVTAPCYDQSWMRDGHELLLEALHRHCSPVDVGEICEGQILVFRWRMGWAASHLAIATATHLIIHAQDGCGVCEVALPASWRRHIAAQFEFPDLRKTV